MERLLEVQQEQGITDKLETEVDTEDSEAEPHFGELIYLKCENLLEEIDEFADTPYQEVLTEFLEDLHRQKILSNTGLLVLHFFIQDQEFMFKYGQTFYWELPRLVADMHRVADTEETGIREVIRISKDWGRLCETAVEPVISIIHYLETDEVDLDRAAGMSLKNQVDAVEEFESLESVGEPLNVNYRNAVLHGGKTGDYDVNPVDREVLLWYRKGDGYRREVVGFEEFREITVRTFASVAVLFVVPIYLFGGYATFGIEDVLDSTRGELEA